MGLAALWLTALVTADVIKGSSEVSLASLFGISALIACAVLPATWMIAVSGVVVLAAVGAGWWDHTWHAATAQATIRVVNVAVTCTAAVAIALVRERREHEHARVVEIAEVAQRAILPTVPRVVGSVKVSTRYLSAAEEALVGGDMFDYCNHTSTRFIVGDVRGKGLQGVVQAARVIRAYRQYASSVADLPEVAKAMSTYLMPFLDDEEFVTASLVDVSEPDSLTIVSCGHPPPMLISASGDDASLEEAPVGLPLGLGVDYSVLHVPWRYGDRLVMYTDGLSEARDSTGAFLDPTSLAKLIAAAAVDQALDVVLDAVRRHVPGGGLHDDLAIVLLENSDRQDTTAPKPLEARGIPTNLNHGWPPEWPVLRPTH